MKHWRMVAEAVGGACLVAAGVLIDPIVGLATAGVLLVLAANFAGGDHAGPT